MKRIVVCCALVVWFGVVSAATYEETFTPKAGKAYSEDINVWVYTSEFAERFGMPKAWVDDELKGAYAVAFRVEARGNRTMFPHKGPDVSMPIQDCIFDVYIPAGTNISWVDRREAGKRFNTPYSPTYLAPQAKEDQVWRQRPVGIESPGKKARRPLIYFGQVGNDKRGSLLLREYDREIYPGVSYISFNRGCWGVGQVAYQLDFLKDSEALQDDYEESDIAHHIEIPKQYMQRVHQNWYERTGKGAAKQWSEIINK